MFGLVEIDTRDLERSPKCKKVYGEKDRWTDTWAFSSDKLKMALQFLLKASSGCREVIQFLATSYHFQDIRNFKSFGFYFMWISYCPNLDTRNRLKLREKYSYTLVLQNIVWFKIKRGGRAGFCYFYNHGYKREYFHS